MVTNTVLVIAGNSMTLYVIVLSHPETVDTVSDKLAEPPPGLIVVPCGDTYNTPKHTVVSTVLLFIIAGSISIICCALKALPHASVPV